MLIDLRICRSRRAADPRWGEPPKGGRDFLRQLTIWLGFACSTPTTRIVCSLARSSEWLFGPDADYERVGDVDQVVFSCGWRLLDDQDTIRIYYGAADTSICVAHREPIRAPQLAFASLRGVARMMRMSCRPRSDRGTHEPPPSAP
jgi:hypothetical protein